MGVFIVQERRTISRNLPYGKKTKNWAGAVAHRKNVAEIGSVLEREPLRQRTQVWFPAHTSGSSPLPEVTPSSVLSWHPLSHSHTHMQTHTYTKLKTTIFYT